jgi:hypothetical protein
LKLTRQFIHNKIVTLNYLLYRRNGWYEVTTYTDFFASAKYLIRFISQALRHIIVWVMVVALFGGTYLAYINKMYWVVAAILFFVSIPIVYDLRRQVKLHKTLSQRLD